MTKEQFTSATPFYIGGKKYNGDKTYYFENNCIVRQVRSSEDDRVILENYECNVVKVGRVGFTAFTYVMDKKVVIKLKFADLVEFKSEEA